MGTLNEDLTAIKSVEDTLNCNKVARFSYTEEAYRCNCADGVTVYDVDNEQNIPVGNAEIMKVNETVLSKGWRSQASSITRMFMNHFLGRLSYNVNKITDNVTGLVNTLVSHLGTADGIATLDANGRIPYSQLPESAIEYKGNWNANTNTPTLSDGMAGATKGDFYIVSVGGTQDLGHGDIEFFANDRVIYDGSIWGRLSAGDVKTVNNVAPVAGNITLTKADIGLGNVDNTADANKTVACAGNATKFAGCTFAQACSAIRSGTLTMTDAGANTTVPVVVCTGATTVGKSGGLSYGNADGSLSGVSKVINLGANAQLYCDVGLYGGNCAGKNQQGCNICAYLCGRDGVFHAKCGLSSDRVYTGNIYNRGAGSDYRDITLSYGTINNDAYTLKLCGITGMVHANSIKTGLIESCTRDLRILCCRTAGVCDYAVVYAKLGTACGDGIIYACRDGDIGYIRLVAEVCDCCPNIVVTPLAERASGNNMTNLRCYLLTNTNSCDWDKWRNWGNAFVVVPSSSDYLVYTCCDCSDVVCCIKCDLGDKKGLVGDASYFANCCHFAVYRSCTPAGHNWMGTTICNDTCANLYLDLHGGYCACYEGCTVHLYRGCSYTFCSCIYNDSWAWACVRLDPLSAQGLCCVNFVDVKLAQPTHY